jgi:hypothetical protein
MRGLSVWWRGVCWTCVLGSLLSFVSPSVAQAAEYGYSLEYRREQSDNITLVRTNPLSDRINIAGATLYLRDPTAQTLRTDIFLDARYEDYSKDTVADRTLVTLNSNITWLIAPESLSWVLEDYYGQTYRDVLLAGAPSNQQNVNIVSTGPDASLRLNPVNTLVASLRAGKYNAEQVESTDPNLDSNRYYGLLGWRYTASATTNLSLNYDTTRRVFQDQDTMINTDYDLRNVFFRLESRRTARSSVSLDLGKSRIVPDGLAAIDGNLVRAQYTLRIGVASNLLIAANSQFTDTSNAILSSGGVRSVTTPIGTVGSSNYYRIKEAEATYTQQRGFGTDRLRLFARRQIYDGVALDQDRAGASLDIGFGLTDTLSGALFGNYTNTNYIDQSFIDRDGQVGVRFTYRAQQRVQVGLEARKSSRNSSDAPRDYDETRLSVSIAYRSIAFHID